MQIVTICMNCQNLFSGKNKKNILKCYLLNILPRVLFFKLPSFSSKLYKVIIGTAMDVLKAGFHVIQKYFEEKQQQQQKNNNKKKTTKKQKQQQQ